MTGYERRRFFERLCELRDAYDARDDEDTVGSHRIDDVVRDTLLALEAIEAEIHVGEAPMGSAVGEEPSR